MTQGDITYDYVLYIDEAGDDGLQKVGPIDANGASEWLVISGVLTRAKYEAAVDHWISDIRVNLEAIQGTSLHYRNISTTRKRKACQQLTKLPIRCFVVASNKKNMRQYDNPRAAIRGGKQWFYNFCVRVLLERVSEICKRDSLAQFGRAGKVKVVFSERGNHSYGQTEAYIELLKYQYRAGTTYLNTRVIDFDVIDKRLVTSQSHDECGGLQLADILSSAFYQAVDTRGKTLWTDDNAKILAPVMARKYSKVAHTGLVLLPTPPSAAKLNFRQKQIFEHYGYEFPDELSLVGDSHSLVS